MGSLMSWITLFFQLMPTIETAMNTIAADTGKPLPATVGDIVNQLTRGAPNHPSLAPDAPPLLDTTPAGSAHG